MSNFDQSTKLMTTAVNISGNHKVPGVKDRMKIVLEEKEVVSLDGTKKVKIYTYKTPNVIDETDPEYWRNFQQLARCNCCIHSCKISDFENFLPVEDVIRAKNDDVCYYNFNANTVQVTIKGYWNPKYLVDNNVTLDPCTWTFNRREVRLKRRQQLFEELVEKKRLFLYNGTFKDARKAAARIKVSITPVGFIKHKCSNLFTVRYKGVFMECTHKDKVKEDRRQLYKASPRNPDEVQRVILVGRASSHQVESSSERLQGNGFILVVKERVKKQGRNKKEYNQIPMSDLEIDTSPRFTVTSNSDSRPLKDDNNNPFTRSRLRFWLQSNVYDKCKCLDVDRNHVSKQMFHNPLHQSYYGHCPVNCFVALVNRQLKPVPKSSTEYTDGFKIFAQRQFLEMAHALLDYSYSECLTPLQYISQVENQKKHRYMSGFEQVRQFFAQTNTDHGVKMIWKTFRDAKCNMMAKSKEKFMHSEHPAFEKNRPRLISSPPIVQASMVGAYNKSALNFIRIFYKEYLPLGLNGEETEQWFNKYFGLDPKTLLSYCDGSSFDAHQDGKIMNIVDDPFHGVFLPYYMHNCGYATLDELGMARNEDNYKLLYGLLAACINRRNIMLRHDMPKDGINQRNESWFKVKLDGTVTSGVAVHTTLGNCLRNLFSWLYCFESLGLQNMKIAVLGDDTVLGGTVEQLEKVRKNYGMFFITKPLDEMFDRECHGNGIRVDSISVPSTTAQFCSKVIVKREMGYIMGRDPVNVFVNTKYMINNESVEQCRLLHILTSQYTFMMYDIPVYSELTFGLTMQQQNQKDRLLEILTKNSVSRGKITKSENRLTDKIYWKFLMLYRTQPVTHPLTLDELRHYLKVIGSKVSLDRILELADMNRGKLDFDYNNPNCIEPSEQNIVHFQQVNFMTRLVRRWYRANKHYIPQYIIVSVGIWFLHNFFSIQYGSGEFLTTLVSACLYMLCNSTSPRKSLGKAAICVCRSRRKRKRQPRVHQNNPPALKQ